MVPETYQNPKRANEAARKQTKEVKALKGQIAQTSRLLTLRWGSPEQGTATRPCTPNSHSQGSQQDHPAACLATTNKAELSVTTSGSSAAPVLLS